MAKNFTAVVHDSHSLGIYEVESGSYQGIIYVTSGSIIGSPVVTHPNVSITFQESGRTFMATYDMGSKAFIRKISI